MYGYILLDTSVIFYSQAFFLGTPGGHTTEILRLTKAMGNQYQPRHYVVARTDKMSEHKIHELEKQMKDDGKQSLVLTRYCNNIAVCIHFNMIHIGRLYEANMEIILK